MAGFSNDLDKSWIRRKSVGELFVKEFLRLTWDTFHCSVMVQSLWGTQNNPPWLASTSYTTHLTPLGGKAQLCRTYY